jgi:hypothetical protein
MVVDFNLCLKTIDQEDFEAGLVEKAAPLTENRRVEFVVTEADLVAGRNLINAQQAVYSEPKRTMVRLREK